MQLLKLHGLGNDFLILLDVDGSQTIDAAFARKVCDRHRGIGADGLIYAGPGADGSIATMTLLNADGSHAEISGNGLRCLGLALSDSGWTPERNFFVDTEAGRRQVMLRERLSATSMRIATEMGDATLLEVPDQVHSLLPDHERVDFVSVGNPHVVVTVKDSDAVDAAVVGAAVDSAVVGGPNVHFVTQGDDGIHMNIYERGVGPTQACGSGACAVAASARLPQTAVIMPGGTVQVTTGSPVVLEGTAHFVATCEVPLG
ncbi:MAG: diaminopimelate epimerase [Acidimicrobiales bacterium]